MTTRQRLWLIFVAVFVVIGVGQLAVAFSGVLTLEYLMAWRRA